MNIIYISGQRITTDKHGNDIPSGAGNGGFSWATEAAILESRKTKLAFDFVEKLRLDSYSH